VVLKFIMVIEIGFTFKVSVSFNLGFSISEVNTFHSSQGESGWYKVVLIFFRYFPAVMEFWVILLTLIYLYFQKKSGII